MEKQVVFNSSKEEVWYHKNEHRKCKIILLKNADTRLKSLVDR